MNNNRPEKQKVEEEEEKKTTKNQTTATENINFYKHIHEYLRKITISIIWFENENGLHTHRHKHTDTQTQTLTHQILQPKITQKKETKRNTCSH